MYQYLCAILIGILLLIVVFYVWRRDEKKRVLRSLLPHENVIKLQFDKRGNCNFITYNGNLYERVG